MSSLLERGENEHLLCMETQQQARTFIWFSHFLQPEVTKAVSYYMDRGSWFVSLYNDAGTSQDVSFVAEISSELTRNCPNGCSGNGECVLGKCQCETGFDGPDCAQSKLNEASLLTN